MKGVEADRERSSVLGFVFVLCPLLVVNLSLLTDSIKQREVLCCLIAFKLYLFIVFTNHCGSD